MNVFSMCLTCSLRKYQDITHLPTGVWYTNKYEGLYIAVHYNKMKFFPKSVSLNSILELYSSSKTKSYLGFRLPFTENSVFVSFQTFSVFSSVSLLFSVSLLIRLQSYKVDVNSFPLLVTFDFLYFLPGTFLE